ncbi:N-acetylglucosamine kinase-like BadF-type ATPase [Kribbella antiqua]|uniref:N-acetylglucosamine kinase-like BadF-type ATPase n=1 Tax=Kribbella antiqua TaxID=2512217 RepID=A0A4R2IYK5_9ACTN|nr:BadF/BadG/BcrA/BcrD ATPase family protein [Kribbella antiqua]TCO50407.1 N-acetylglucosamine kinase-like BadF-type ATPase [Kribbella antiqua]
MEAASSRPREVIGIDVGGTKTHLALGLGGTVVKEWTVSTPSWRTHSLDHNAVALHRLIRDWLGDEALKLPLVVGAHGCDSTEQCDAFSAALRGYFTGDVLVVNDAELLVPAASRRDGIGLIAGTGSIAVARVNGQLVTAGGWGWVLGDEGGSAGLVREATRAVLGQLDRGEPIDPLSRRLLASFGVADGAQLAMAVTDSTSPAWLGERSIEIFQAADEGSALAGLVIREAGRQLAELVDRLIGRGVAAGQVVVGGSVLLGQRRLYETFLKALSGRHPDVAVHVLDRAPVFGALALADDTTHS